MTPEEARPWLKYRSRDLLYREAVIAFLGAGEKEAPEDAYCKACRELGDDDCANCDRQIEVIDV